MIQYLNSCFCSLGCWHPIQEILAIILTSSLVFSTISFKSFIKVHDAFSAGIYKTGEVWVWFQSPCDVQFAQHCLFVWCVSGDLVKNQLLLHWFGFEFSIPWLLCLSLSSSDAVSIAHECVLKSVFVMHSPLVFLLLIALVNSEVSFAYSWIGLFVCFLVLWGTPLVFSWGLHLICRVLLMLWLF